MKFWQEPAKDIEIIAEHDVVVCGGGPAGCAAAVTAARAGTDTLLVEREGHLGGATVNQLVTVILSKNGVDFQGIWFEWYEELKRLNAVREVIYDHDGFKGTVDPEQVKYAWDNLLSNARVKILHRVSVSGAILSTNKVEGVIVETCAGRKAIKARQVIDATGDGCLAAAAGVPFDQGVEDNKYAMALTKVFRLGGIKWAEDWPNEEDFKILQESLKKAVEDGELTHPVAATNERIINYMKYRCWELPGYRHELISVMSRVLKVNPLDPFELSSAEREGREQARQCAGFYCKHMPGFENAYLLDTSSHIGIRSSRRFRGISQVTDYDVISFNKYSDSIAKASWDIDIWPVDSYTSATVERNSDAAKRRVKALRNGAFYDIRYGCLVPEFIDNLLIAGRCISATHIAESSLRIQQTCQATGEAAGLAASLCVMNNQLAREINRKVLIDNLNLIRRRPIPKEIGRYL